MDGMTAIMAERGRWDFVRPGWSKRDMLGNREDSKYLQQTFTDPLQGGHRGGHRDKLGVAVSIKSSKTGKQEITIECDKWHDRGM